jgi:peptidoglycan/LPS O-acetylase OafA/YrhL
MDVWWLTHNTSASLGAIQNDAASFANEYMPLVPIGTGTTIVAFTWALIAILMLATAFYYGVWKPLRREVDASYDTLVRR